MQEIIKHYKGDDSVFPVTIQTTFEGFAINSREALEAMAQKYSLTIPVGHSGSKGNPSPLLYNYSAKGTPWVVIIDKFSRVRFSGFHLKPSKAIALIDRLAKE